MISSTSGFCICFKNCRAYEESDSTYRRCPSAKIVSNASDDFPEPESPVIATILFLGISTVIFFKLCVRAPRTMILSLASGAAEFFVGFFFIYGVHSRPRKIYSTKRRESGLYAVYGYYIRIWDFNNENGSAIFFGNSKRAVMCSDDFMRNMKTSIVSEMF